MTCLETTFAFRFEYFIPEVDGFSFIDVGCTILQATFVVRNDEPLTNSYDWGPRDLSLGC
jgi:hypothetical protein